ncbi:MAG TPA: malonate decarboxylase subunit epsilon [Steroidobacteraceae bacterium]|nr:malonate decarboxylase subunit epsilon [Steroidobacteraceae bacterium]
MSIAYLFPGQGAQRPGFLHRLPKHPAVSATFDEAAAVLGLQVLGLDDDAALASTVAVQLGVLIAGVALTRVLAHEGITADAAAGLSVGAFGAAVACEALSFADALPLVKLRGECMQRAYPRGFGMAVITGLQEPHVAAIVEQIGGAGAELYIANINAPAQIVLSGSDRALVSAIEMAHAAGARRAERMAVSVPSHCPLLDGVAQQLAAAMTAVEMHDPRRPYVSNRRARVVHDAQGVRDDLIRNVANAVRWYDSVTVLYELGVRLFIEPPPGQVLSHLAQQAFAEVRAVAVEDLQLNDILLLAERERQAPR